MGASMNTLLIFFTCLAFVLSVDPNNFLGIECTKKTAKTACNGVPNSNCAQTTTTDVFECACNEEVGYVKNKDDTKTCVKYSGLDMECQPNTASSDCEVADSKCLDSGGNQFRCQCRNDYIRTTVKGEEVCGLIVLGSEIEDCKLCEDNEGTCFSMDGGPTRAGCQCDVSRSGDDCEITNVNVVCNTNDFVMQICYTPHEGFVFGDPDGAAMYVNQKGGETACVGSATTDFCNLEEVGLALPLDDTERGTCGTSFQPIDVGNVQYETLIRVVRNRTVIGTDTDITFRCFCSFVKYTYQKFSPVGIGGSSGGSTGQISTPNLQFQILDSFLVPIRQGVAMRVGDTMFLQIALVDDDVYGSLAVQSCVASSQPNIYAYNAFTTSLLDDSCPAEGQTVLTETNNFDLVDDALTVIRTGAITVFSVPTGSSVFLHCRLKVCTSADVDGCPQANCTDDTPKRRKRAAEETVNISQQLFISDPKKDGVIQMSSSTLIIAITASVLIFLVFAAFVIFMVRRLNKNKGKTDRSVLAVKMANPVWTTQRPQRFVQPRL